MDDNKEKMFEVTANSPAETKSENVVEFDREIPGPEMNDASASSNVYYNNNEMRKPEEKKSWGDKKVTRKFLIIALAVTLIVNVAATAGMLAVFRGGSKGRQNMPDGGGKPGSEMSDNNSQSGGPGGGNGNDNMTPPGGSGDQQAQGGSESKASIGIVIREDDSAVYVAQVNGDNAKEAGFEEGDKILSVDGNEVKSSDDLISQVQSHKAGDTITVKVERDSKEIEIKTVLE